MLPFRPIKIEDKPLFDTIVKPLKSNFCAHCFSDLLIWKFAYNTQICFVDDFVFITQTSNNKNIYLVPLGKGDILKAIDMIKQDACERDIDFKIYSINENQKAEILSLTDIFNFQEQRNSEDYIYTSESLINLSGKKLHSKRNFINRFLSSNDGRWRYEDINEENSHEAFNYHLEWCSLNENNANEDFKNETTAISTAFNNFKELSLKGGILRLDNKIIAFTLGSQATEDMFVVHFEKADYTIAGSYPMINNQFAIHNFENIKYINREEDLGLEGLRKAKLSYNPEFLAKNYVAYLK